MGCIQVAPVLTLYSSSVACYCRQGCLQLLRLFVCIFMYMDVVAECIQEDIGSDGHTLLIPAKVTGACDLPCGTELTTSGRAARALNCRAISPARFQHYVKLEKANMKQRVPRLTNALRAHADSRISLAQCLRRRGLWALRSPRSGQAFFFFFP